MKQTNHFLIAAAVGLVFAVGCSPADEEVQGENGSELNAQSNQLWPVSKGAATVTVCWRPVASDPNQFPVPAFGLPPTAAMIAERKGWVREIAETQWNARTPVKFVGWKDCGSDASKMVQLTPMDSTIADGGYVPGQPHTYGLGTVNRGKPTFLNFFFADERIYQMRVIAAYNAAPADKKKQYVPQQLKAQAWIPAACGDDYAALLSADISDPAVVAKAVSLFKPCFQENVLHELGHLAGFAHEQYRTDVSSACEKQLAPGGTDTSHIPVNDRGNLPLGPFDGESIMSYCRKEKAPVLTGEDVRMTNVVYRGGVWCAPDGG